MIKPYAIAFWIFFILGIPCPALATQMHGQAEGILVHQIGHVFFLVSMVILYVTIQSKGLQKEKGWRAFQYSALFFALWNLDAILVHFLDNQSGWIRTQIHSPGQIGIQTLSVSHRPAFFYYIMRLDHLLCLPGMFFLWRGLSHLLHEPEYGHETGQDTSEIQPTLTYAKNTESNGVKEQDTDTTIDTKDIS